MIKLSEDHYIVVDNKEMHTIPTPEAKEILGVVDVEKHWENFRIENPNTVGGFQEQYISFLYGYNQALEDNKEKKYTEKDLKRAYACGKGVGGLDMKDGFEEFIQSLQPKTEWEVEMVDGKLKLKP